MNNLTISQSGRELVREFEGTELEAYQDPAGLWTIGTGHLITDIEMIDGFIIINNDAVYFMQDGITQVQADQLLAQDLAKAQSVLNHNVKTPLNQNQFDALGSLVFNIGGAAFNKSTLLKCLNKNMIEEAANEFLRWVYVNGHKIKGLERRRAAERALFVRL